MIACEFVDRSESFEGSVKTKKCIRLPKEVGNHKENQII
ncbi:hypothetical protein P872_10615 [Rhodonellum psychrophilum GCM71 = DSM 17998]|uniref:Uncharacterized protein n=1 Tax=Rhodonellum psychrophilum GCM71 = DSM 17998 TaxID=1123057 RepID=U5BTY2_9BACT|nr:hypothetical protein P872_10615 [Rhodonellum psychrophilum GCM71 = DSM 17998]